MGNALRQGKLEEAIEVSTNPNHQPDHEAARWEKLYQLHESVIGTVLQKTLT